MAHPFSRRHLILGAAAALGSTALMRWDGTGVRLAGSTAPATGGLGDPELKYAQQRADLCGAGNAVGVGLRGEYFAQADLAGAVLLTRVDRFVDFDAQMDWPADQPAPRSARWSGWIKPPLAGAYRFHADGPGMRVSVANRVVADADAPVRPETAAVDMALGRFYPITVELRRIEARFTGRWRLEWTAPHGMRYVVPTALLFVPNNPTR